MHAMAVPVLGELRELVPYETRRTRTEARDASRNRPPPGPAERTSLRLWKPFERSMSGSLPSSAGPSMSD